MLNSMNDSAENNAMPFNKKRIMVLFNPSIWSIKWKARFNFLLRAIVAIGLLLMLINVLQRRMFIREAHDKLTLLSETKTQFIHDYFTHLEKQLRSFSTDHQTLDAFTQLSTSFAGIESEDFYTPTVKNMEQINALLEGFYTTEIMPVLGDHKTNLKALIPNNNKQRILQYLYIAGNTKPLGSKILLNKAEDGSSYSYMHAQYHPQMVRYSRQEGVSDILFVDYKTGDVFYSLKKNLDFATSLFEGPYRNTGLGMAFKKAIAQQEDAAVSFTDASAYAPALLKSETFMSVPVFSGSQISGVIIFALNNTALDQLLHYDKEEISTAKSLKSLIIGNDFIYRCDDPDFLANKEKYIHQLKRSAENADAAQNCALFGSTSMVQSVDHEAFSDAIKGKEGLTTYRTETGTKVIAAYKPLRIGDLNWTLITQTDRSDTLAPLYKFLFVLMGITLFIAMILYYMSSAINNSISSRLEKLKSGIVALSRGEQAEELKMHSADEIGVIGSALEQLNSRLNESAAFLNELSKDNLNNDFPVNGAQDYYGLSVNNLKNSLLIKKEAEENRRKEDEIRNWTTEGIAKFNEILRTDNNSIENLSCTIVKNLVEYMSANQSGLFLMEDEENRPYLNQVATYAYNRQKYLKKRIEVGEGLAGMCVLEKKTVLTNKIPDNYITITSGLGEAKPKCLMIIPLKKDEEVLGVVEIASLVNFKPHEVEFVEKIAESIAAALITVKLHIQTKHYLERFQQQAEEMKSQDEELRQNIEELQATHEQMERLKQEETKQQEILMKGMEDYRKLLLDVIDQLPGKIFVKDHDGKLLLLNSEVAKIYGKTVNELIGTSDFDNHAPEDARVYHDQELKIMAHGAETYIQEENLTGQKRYLKTTKMPFYIHHLNTTGLLGYQVDVTEFVEIDIENKRKEAELQKETALMNALLTNIPENIYFKDKDSRFLRFSKSMLKLFGLENPEDLLGKTDFDFFSEEHAKPAFEDEQRIIKTGKAIIDMEEKNIMEDGHESWVTTTKMPLRDINGNIIGTFGISKDITHLKKMQQDAVEAAEMLKAQEEELRQNLEEMQATQEDLKRQLEENEKMKRDLSKEKALMDALMNNVPDSIYFKDKQSKFLLASKSMLKLFGLKNKEDLVGKSDFDFFSEEHARPAYEDEQRIIKSGKAIIDLEEKEVLEDGRVNWVNTTKMPMYSTEGEIIGTFGISKNISHIKKMQQEAQEHTEELRAQEEELRQNLEEMQTTQEDLRRQLEENEKIQNTLNKEKALMDALMNNVPDSIYFKDKQSRFVLASNSMLKLFGLKKAEDLIGKSDFDFFSEEHARPAYVTEQNIIKTGKAVIDLEEKEVMEDGRVNWVNTTKMPLLDTKGEIIGTFGISKNITHIRKLQQQAQEYTEELKSQEEELRQNLEEMQTTQEDLKRQLEENEKIKRDLSKEKALMDALMNNVPDSIYFKDKQSRFVLASKSMLKLFGLKKEEELIGKSDFDFFSEEHARPAYVAEQNIIKTGKAIIDLEEREVMEDGRVNWVNTTKMPLLNTEGEIIGTFGISKNISHIKKLQQEAQEHTEELRSQEEELRQNLEEMMTTQEDLKRQLEENEKIQAALSKEKTLMDALMNNIPDSIYFKDKQSRFILASKSMLKMFGLKKEEELVGKSDFDFFSEEHARPAYLDEQKIIKTGEAIIDMQEKEVMEDGRINWVNTTKMPLKDDGGKIIGTFGISKSITQIKKLEIEANEKAKRLKETEEKLTILIKENTELKKKIKK
jgi:PAS domain S-box-containing protein